MGFSLAHTSLGAGLIASVVLVSPVLNEHSATSPLTREPEGVSSTAPGHAVAEPGTGVQPEATLDDQVDLAITVYNSNIALVRDVRQLTLPEGIFDLRFVDIAATINPATVHFRSLSEPSQLSVLEQNYEYDLLEPQKLLQKYVGREVTLVRRHQEGGTTREEEVRALLLAFNNGPVWRIGNEIVTGMHADHIRFPELPENLYSRPTMVWALQNEGAESHQVEAAYLAGNLSWNADYVLTVSRDDTLADLDGWVTLTNNSGTAFPNARLQLVAGDLHRVSNRYDQQAFRQARAVSEAADAASFVEEAFAEYHLYTLGRRTSVQNQETKQISLLSGTGVPVEKTFVVEGRQFYYRNYQNPGSPLKDPVKVYFNFTNEEEGGLGMPMPAGTVRVYQADSQGGIQFVGEDRIAHTPKDEGLSLHIGNAFDIICERKQTDFRKISSVVHEIEFEITLRNHKDTPIIVEVNEPIGGDWRMLEASHTWTKTAAWAARFSVPVDPNGTSVLRYRTLVRW